MKAKFFTIEVLSNLHVGNGEINFGMIDNLIQRDAITELPNINSSSLKGALREFFNHLEKSGKKKGSWTVNNIFGSDPREQKKRQQGSVRFFEADLIAIPVRDDNKPYVMVSSQETIDGLKAKMKNFDVKVSEKFNEAIKTPQIVPFVAFKDICSDEELPVLSRNNLESGQSTNLWYEQVLPKHSILVFAVMGEGETFESFCKELNGVQVQIGANATIGYGFCQIKEMC